MMPAIRTKRAVFIRRARDWFSSLRAKPGKNDANDEEHR
jgi:hypothetical protein